MTMKKTSDIGLLLNTTESNRESHFVQGLEAASQGWIAPGFQLVQSKISSFYLVFGYY
jgi:hypothetical protein